MAYKGKIPQIGDEVRRYGFYTCPECFKDWESAQTFCTYLGGNEYKPCSKQSCKDCDVMTLPRDTEALLKPDGADRHNDLSQGHRSDLCERCLSGQGCSSTY